MLYPVIIIKDNEHPGTIEQIDNIYTCKPVNASQKEELISAYRHYSNFTTQNFGACFLLKTHLNKEMLPLIISFFFLPCIVNISNHKICILMGDEEDILEDAEEQIKQFALKQGIKKITIYKLPLKSNSQTILSFTPESFIEKYSKAIERFLPKETVFFLYASSVDIQQLHTIINEIETIFKTKNPHLYELLVKQQHSANESFLLQEKYEAAITELENFKKHNEMIRSENEAKQLQDYYTNEYEILPLWYKKLGHLIKVILGKRSLRSLFTDKAKKEKN